MKEQIKKKRTKQEAINYKIEILKDMEILKENDDREIAVREILSRCKKYSEMTTKLHDVIIGDKSIDELCREYKA